MNQPTVRTAPNFSPLMRWLEDNSVLPKGTTKQVNDLADKVKGLGDALKQSGVIR